MWYLFLNQVYQSTAPLSERWYVLSTKIRRGKESITRSVYAHTSFVLGFAENGVDHFLGQLIHNGSTRRIPLGI